MKEDTVNHDRNRSGNNEQQNSNLPNTERQNDAPASGIKNNDAWITGLEPKTPTQEGNPPHYVSADSDDTDLESRSNAIKDPDQWKTGDESRNPDDWKTGDNLSELKKQVGVADQNNDSEKENSF